jgi:hypothetical protein
MTKICEQDLDYRETEEVRRCKSNRRRQGVEWPAVTSNNMTVFGQRSAKFVA